MEKEEGAPTYIPRIREIIGGDLSETNWRHTQEGVASQYKMSLSVVKLASLEVSLEVWLSLNLGKKKSFLSAAFEP